VERLTELINRGETFHNVSISCDGDWFIRTNQSVCKCAFDIHRGESDSDPNGLDYKMTTADFVSQTVQAAEDAKADGIDLPYSNITSITFVPNSKGYICIGKTTVGTPICLWGGDGIPPSLAAYLADVPPNIAVQYVSVGFGGSWVVILQTGAVYSKGIPESLKRHLRSTLQGTIRVCVFKYHGFVLNVITVHIAVVIGPGTLSHQFCGR